MEKQIYFNLSLKKRNFMYFKTTYQGANTKTNFVESHELFTKKI